MESVMRKAARHWKRPVVYVGVAMDVDVLSFETVIPQREFTGLQYYPLYADALHGCVLGFALVRDGEGVQKIIEIVENPIAEMIHSSFRVLGEQPVVLTLVGVPDWDVDVLWAKWPEGRQEVVICRAPESLFQRSARMTPSAFFERLLASAGA